MHHQMINRILISYKGQKVIFFKKEEKGKKILLECLRKYVMRRRKVTISVGIYTWQPYYSCMKRRHFQESQTDF